MLRVNRLAAAIDITEAGTSAPIEMAAKAKPANQLGNSWLMRAGTAPFAPKGAKGFTCAAIAMYPVRASSPSISEQIGNSAVLRLTTFLLLLLKTPVIECG